MPRRFEEVVRQLTDDVVSGLYPQGSVLPPAPELGVRLGAGRGVVREAVRSLEARGLLEASPGRGVIVRHSDRWPLGDPGIVLALVERGEQPGLLAELIACRAALERDAASEATAAATAGDLFLLRDRVITLSRAAVTTRAVQEEVDFHHA